MRYLLLFSELFPFYGGINLFRRHQQSHNPSKQAVQEKMKFIFCNTFLILIVAESIDIHDIAEESLELSIDGQNNYWNKFESINFIKLLIIQMSKNLLNWILFVTQQVKLVARIKYHWDRSCIFLCFLKDDWTKGVLVPPLNHLCKRLENIIFVIRFKTWSYKQFVKWFERYYILGVAGSEPILRNFHQINKL